MIGAGPAGLMAALTAARAGARVIMCDEDFRLGGRLLGDRREIAGLEAHEWVEAVLQELAGHPDVQIMPRTTVFGAYDGRTFGAVERVADDVPIPPRSGPASASGVLLPNKLCWRPERSNGASCLAATIVRVS